MPKIKDYQYYCVHFINLTPALFYLLKLSNRILEENAKSIIYTMYFFLSGPIDSTKHWTQDVLKIWNDLKHIIKCCDLLSFLGATRRINNVLGQIWQWMSEKIAGDITYRYWYILLDMCVHINSQHRQIQQILTALTWNAA